MSDSTNPDATKVVESKKGTRMGILLINNVLNNCSMDYLDN